MEKSIANEGAMDKAYWACQWQRQMQNATFRGDSAAFWDNWAKSLPLKMGHSGYVEEVLNRLRLLPEDSLLDVGAGTGALAIPLARRVHRVTALDQSPYMLEIILDKAKRGNISNIVTLNTDWTEAMPGKDIKQHDVVLVSRSLPSGDNIVSSLELIDSAARRACYITWKAESYDELEAELCRLLGIEYHPFPDYIVLYNLLYSMGIRANAELFRTCGQRMFRSLDEAYIQIVRSQPIEDKHAKQQVMDFLATRLSCKDGLYCQPKNVTWALLRWQKE